MGDMRIDGGSAPISGDNPDEEIQDDPISDLDQEIQEAVAKAREHHDAKSAEFSAKIKIKQSIGMEGIKEQIFGHKPLLGNHKLGTILEAREAILSKFGDKATNKKALNKLEAFEQKLRQKGQIKEANNVRYARQELEHPDELQFSQLDSVENATKELTRLIETLPEDITPYNFLTDVEEQTTTFLQNLGYDAEAGNLKAGLQKLKPKFENILSKSEQKVAKKQKNRSEEALKGRIKTGTEGKDALPRQPQIKQTGKPVVEKPPDRLELLHKLRTTFLNYANSDNSPSPKEALSNLKRDLRLLAKRGSSKSAKMQQEIIKQIEADLKNQDLTHRQIVEQINIQIHHE